MVELTARECGIAHLVACGWNDQRIGAFFFIAPHSVHNHLTRIRAATKTLTRAHLAYWWYENVLRK